MNGLILMEEIKRLLQIQQVYKIIELKLRYLPLKRETMQPFVHLKL